MVNQTHDAVSLKPGGALEPPLFTQTLQLRQEVTMYPSNSSASTRLTKPQASFNVRSLSDT
jgi:hypothetical protein